MPTDQAESFIDNWAYLKAELQWLDRVLMLAVARQRKDSKDIDRIAQSKADRATSHWWKGIVALEGNIAYDEYRQPHPVSSGAAKPSPQQQIEQRIRSSQQQGIVLALPELCNRLGLTPFEKNLVLISLAPELNRRYARLYRYLRGEELLIKTDLPSLDLALRLFCRNDAEWRSARNRLMGDSPLTRYRLLQLLPGPEETLLSCSLKLIDPLVNYLMAEQPGAEALEILLAQLLAQPEPALAPKIGHSLGFNRSIAVVTWEDLILPQDLIQSLQYLERRVLGYVQAEERWGYQPQADTYSPGAMVLLTGPRGTGKTLAAQALAHALHTPLFYANLAEIDPEQYPQLLQDLATQAPTVLLIQSAQRWLSRTASAPVWLNQFWAQRRSTPSITLLSMTQVDASHRIALPLDWRKRLDRVLDFPIPSSSDRLKLWRQAFPADIPLASDIPWKALAQQLSLSGGEIGAIAQETILYAASVEAPKVAREHLLQVLTQQGKSIQIKRSGSKRSRVTE